jgi:hypothetical protein
MFMGVTNKTDFGLEDWIYLHLLVQSLITINYNNSQEITA